MNFTGQNLKRLLSGFFAGGVFFCAWTQDLVMDSVSTVPQNTLNADSADYDKVTTERLITFSKNFSLRMLQNGKATPADIERMLQLLAQDPDSLQLNVMLQNMFSGIKPAIRNDLEKKYCELAENNPSSWIMQTFAAEILLRNKKTLPRGIDQLYQVFQQNLLNSNNNTSDMQQAELESFRTTLLSRLLLLTFVHVREKEYQTISEFIRKNPAYRKYPDLVTDWLLTSSGKRETSEPLPLLPGNIIPGKATTALRNFYIGQRELLALIAKGQLPSERKCQILMNIFTRWGKASELKNALQQYLKSAKNKRPIAYAMLGDLTNGKTRNILHKKAAYYQQAFDNGLSYYNERAIMLFGIYLDLNDLKKAEQILLQIKRKAPKTNTLPCDITLYIAKKDYKNALAKIALLPESFIRFQQEAYVRSLRKDYQGAYRAIEKAWLQIKKHKIKLRDNMFLYFSIDIAEKSKNIQKVIEWLEPEIRKNPSDTNLKNTLGYILADHNVELQKAYRLLKDVVTAEPENGAYLDSMAWVLYRLKRYEEAKKYILLALKYHSDRVVLDHAGDIFYALKDYKMAAEYWQKALRSQGETDAKSIQDKLKKLQSGRKVQ